MRICSGRRAVRDLSAYVVAHLQRPLVWEFGLRGEFHAGQIEAAEKFEQEDADGASVEIAEWMNREKAAFGECEQFEQRV